MSRSAKWWQGERETPSFSHKGSNRRCNTRIRVSWGFQLVLQWPRWQNGAGEKELHISRRVNCSARLVEYLHADHRGWRQMHWNKLDSILAACRKYQRRQKYRQRRKYRRRRSVRMRKKGSLIYRQRRTCTRWTRTWWVCGGVCRYFLCVRIQKRKRSNFHWLRSFWRCVKSAEWKYHATGLENYDFLQRHRVGKRICYKSSWSP